MIAEHNKQKNILTVYLTSVLCLAPVFKNYGIGIISIPEIFMVMGIVFCVLFEKPRGLKKTGPLILFFSVMTFLSLIAAFKYPISYTVTVRFWIYILFIYMFNDSFDFELGCKILVCAAIVNSVYLLIQDTVWVATKIALQWNIPGLPVKIAEGYLDGYILNPYNVRFSGFFSEPAQFSHYAINCVIILMFKKNLMSGIKRWGTLAIVILAILKSGSGAGTMQVLILAVIFFGVSVVENRRNILLVFGLIAIAIVIIYVLIPYLNSLGLNSGYLRVLDDREISTTNSRVNFCFQVFRTFSIREKIFGIGYGNYDYYVINRYGEFASTYCNGAAYVLCGGGYLGFIFYLNVFWQWLKHTSGIAKIKVISLLISAVYSGQTLSIDFVLSACFILSCFEYQGVLKNGQYDIEKSSVS